MIEKLEGTLRNEQQNIEQLQTPTMGVTINNKSTTTEPPKPGHTTPNTMVLIVKNGRNFIIYIY